MGLLLTVTALTAVMNAFGPGPIRYGALGVYGLLFSATVLPRAPSAVATVCDLLTGRARLGVFLWVVFVALTLVTYLRGWSDPLLRAGALPSTLFFLSLSAIAVSVVRQAARRGRDCYLRALLYSAHVFVVVNMLGYFLGFRGDREFVNSGVYGQARVLGVLGIQVERTLLPLAPGLTTFGVVAGAASIVALVGVRTLRGWERGWNALVLPLAILGLLVTDSRGSILFLVIGATLYLTVLAPSKLRLANLLLVPLSALFLFLLTLSGVLAGSGGAADLSRGSLILSGREVVWINALTFLSDLSTDLLWGFGYMGHYVSGVSAGYSDYFTNWGGESPEFFTLHNFVLQLVFDTGLVGLLVALLLLSWSLRALARLRPSMGPTASMTAAYLLYMVISGSTESALSVYSLLTMAPIMLVSAYLAFRIDGDAQRRGGATRGRGNEPSPGFVATAAAREGQASPVGLA